MIRPLSVAVAAFALLVALGGEALASECHKNCNGGYLAMTALVAGSLAVGSAALGTRMGGSAALKRTDDPPPPPSEPVSALRDAHESARPAAAASAPPGPDVAKAATDYAGKVAKEMAPHGSAIDSSLSVAQRVIANEDRVAGLAEGLTDAAVEEAKDVVKDATKVTTPSASVGTTAKYCRQCGTATREGARFCGSCGMRL